MRRPLDRAPLLLVPLLVASACSGTSPPPEPEPAPPARVSIVPAAGTDAWRPDRQVEITAKRGHLTEIAVETRDGDEVAGSFDDKRSTWTSRWPLEADTKYRVRSVAVNPDGRKTTKEADFRTLEPESTVEVYAIYADDGTYGVGLPIVIRFEEPISKKKHKKQAERAMELRTSEPITGAWHWMNDEVVHFRPEKYWPTGTEVRLVAHLSGARLGEDTYGKKDRSVRFDIGEKHVSVVNTNTHMMRVKKDGEVVRKMPISAGDAEHPSSSGTFAAINVQEHVTMDSASYGVPVDSAGGYSIDSYWNVRYTWSGQFVHGAPWSVGSQGRANVSHGCVNASTADAKWFYNFSRIGDIIKVKGTGREAEWGNGWTDWDRSFDEYLEGSATGAPVHALTMDGVPRQDGSSSASPAPSPTGSPSADPTDTKTGQG